MAIHFGALPGVLFHPTDTFEKLKGDANLWDGLKVYVAVAVIGLVVTLLLTVVMLSIGIAGISVIQYTSATTWLRMVLESVLSIIVGLLIFLALCWLITKFTGLLSSKGSDFGRTTCLLSYTGAAFYLFIMLPLTVVMLLATWFGLSGMVTSAAHLGSSSAMSLFGSMLIFLIILLIMLIWEWLIAGRAVATANETSWGNGIVAVLLAGIVFFVVAFVIMFLIGVALWQAGVFNPAGGFSGPTGFAPLIP